MAKEEFVRTKPHVNIGTIVLVFDSQFGVKSLVLRVLILISSR